MGGTTDTTAAESKTPVVMASMPKPAEVTESKSGGALKLIIAIVVIALIAIGARFAYIMQHAAK